MRFSASGEQISFGARAEFGAARPGQSAGEEAHRVRRLFGDHRGICCLPPKRNGLAVAGGLAGFAGGFIILQRRLVVAGVHLGHGQAMAWCDAAAFDAPSIGHLHGTRRILARQFDTGGIARRVRRCRPCRYGNEQCQEGQMLQSSSSTVAISAAISASRERR